MIMLGSKLASSQSVLSKYTIGSIGRVVGSKLVSCAIVQQLSIGRVLSCPITHQGSYNNSVIFVVQPLSLHGNNSVSFKVQQLQDVNI